ncbi:hypothetical protein HMPREF9103_01323 [Lentilactobacillus parafarraginis F0439]|uniref:Uncharacterized protein n=1 Tax=Lentilactobacillus parafarraginis F0439 TaxID=797515 RepID=G9ZNM0_9LACO|nr:hypothetical protein HMPREF9103_01323 [Lentilactobacillus parafarraginis F0439]
MEYVNEKISRWITHLKPVNSQAFKRCQYNILNLLSVSEKAADHTKVS